MGIDTMKYTLSQGAHRLWRVETTLRKQVFFAQQNPGRAAGKVALAVAEVGVLSPIKALSAVAHDVGRAIVEPAVWAGRGILASSTAPLGQHQARQQRGQERAQQTWVVPMQDPSDGGAIDMKVIDQLRHGLIGAFAKVEAIESSQKMIKINWGAYGSHAGFMMAVKAAKAVLLAAIVHLPGINHLALAHFLSPASEERLLDAVGLTTTHAQVAAGTGILAATRSRFAQSLRDTNLWEKDLETRQYRHEQVALRSDILTLQSALKALDTLRSEGTGEVLPDPRRAAKIHEGALRKLQTGLRAAQRLQQDISGDTLAKRFVGLSLDNQAITTRADQMLSRFKLMSSYSAQDLDGLRQAPAPEPVARRSAFSLQVPSLLPPSVNRFIKDRKLGAEIAQTSRSAARYAAEVKTLEQQASDDELPVPFMLRLTHVKNKHSLALAAEQLAIARRALANGSMPSQTAEPVIGTLEKHIVDLKDQIAAYRSYQAHPAVQANDGEWGLIAPGYTAKVNMLTKEMAVLDHKIAAVVETLGVVQNISLRPVLQQRQKKLLAKLQMARFEYDKVSLDLALAAHQKRQLPPEKTAARLAANRFLGLRPLDNRLQFNITQEALGMASRMREQARDQQRRTSQYVRADVAPVSGAPEIINTLLKGAWYSVAVVPLVNLPYWGIIRAQAAWSNYNFRKTMQTS